MDSIFFALRELFLRSNSATFAVRTPGVLLDYFFEGTRCVLFVRFSVSYIEFSTQLMPSWLEEIPTSSPERPSTQRARSGSRAPSAPFTPAPQQRSPASSPPPRQGSFDSPLIDPSLRGQSAEGTQDSQVSLVAPTSAQRPSVGGKQPKRHFLQDSDVDVSDSENADGVPTDDDADNSNPAKRRRFAQSEGEKLGLSERSIMDAKRFANVSQSLLAIGQCILF